MVAALPHPAPGFPAPASQAGLRGGRSLGSRGRVLGNRPVAMEVKLLSGRDLGGALDQKGFTLVAHAPPSGLDLGQAASVAGPYYADCEVLLSRETGATRVVAFEHRTLHCLEPPDSDQWAGRPAARAVVEPEAATAEEEQEEAAARLADWCAHSDYTLATASARVELLTQPPPGQGTFHATDSAGPRVDPREVDALLKGRWGLYSVWRSLGVEPLERLPLALCDATSMRLRDLELLLVQHVDRISERYFARYSRAHRWCCFPHVVRGEAVIQKRWDSRGRDFLDDSVLLAALSTASGTPATVPATFCMGALLGDLADKASTEPGNAGLLEVRLAAFFET